MAVPTSSAVAAVAAAVGDAGCGGSSRRWSRAARERTVVSGSEGGFEGMSVSPSNSGYTSIINPFQPRT